MEKLNFDSGVREYKINGNGILRFNPSDPNLYTRFMDAMNKIQSVEERLTNSAKEIENISDQQESGAAALRLMSEADREIKQVLADVFGQGNDFDKILGGVNLLAVAGNGERVITNFLNAIQPVLVAGAQAHTKQQVDSAVAQAKLNRAQRRAQQ